MKARIAIIGGSGVYDPNLFNEVEKVKSSTPFGPPSGPIHVCRVGDIPVMFLSRHGKGHVIPPHMVNYKANLWALKELGAEYVISPSAVGSLKENIHPGELVILDQFIDMTKTRDYTFFDGGRTMHVSMAEPYCSNLRKIFIDTASEKGIAHHPSGTYVCIEGPRFSTKAESRMFSQFADVVGMTAVPETQLARELELCYLNVSMVTDYDVWKGQPVNIPEIIRVMTENIEKVKTLLEMALPKIVGERSCECATAMANAEA